MKISTTWSQADWDKALKKVWELSRDFDEILEFGLEHGFITSSDIIHASDMYRDPDKIYDDPEIEDFIKSVPLSDLMKTIQDQYPIDDIVDELDKDDIMDAIGDDELFSHIENSSVMDMHDDDVKEQVYHEYVDEWIEEMKAQEKDYIDNLYNANADDFHKFLCDTLGCGYYDQSIVDKLKEKLKNNSFGIKY